MNANASGIISIFGGSRSRSPPGIEEEDTEKLVASETDHYLHDYVEQVKRRLALHRFTQTFELEKEPKRQDKWATWIEYLNCECS